MLHDIYINTDVVRLIYTTVAPGGSQYVNRADQYTRGQLARTDLLPSPFAQFHIWFEAARSFPVPLAESVCLSTASLPSGSISSRFVYLKELDTRGFVLYSNWDTSRKAKDVKSNPQAALAFWWREMERQVRVEGPCERLTREESQAYYGTRARGSKIGAYASQQSLVLPEEEGGREVLERRVKATEEMFEGKSDEEMEVPEFWGGLRVIPQVVEFWQGRESRLHDRFRYTKDEKSEGGWKIERLSP
jgi:pyridoxamine 5'-phosphate oxidase